MTREAAARSPVPSRASAPWFLRFAPVERPAARVVCFAHAGGGASSYFGWTPLLGPAIDQLAVQLPGRETRILERPVSDLPSLSRELADVVAGWADAPLVFFGHSFGGLLAYEVARALRARHAIEVRGLVASAAQAPHLRREIPPLRHLPDELLVEELSRGYQGIPSVVLAQRDLLNAFVPVLRADLSMLETYRHDAAEPLPCPVLALAGEDDRLATPEMVRRWAELTTGRFALRVFGGGHFFVRTARAEVASLVRELAIGGATP